MMFVRSSSQIHMYPSRVYLEERVLPFLGQHPPVLDIGHFKDLDHYKYLVGTKQYVTVDIRRSKTGPTIRCNCTYPELVLLARKHYVEYGSILLNGVIGFGVNTKYDLDATFQNFYELLRPGGHLLIGWNESKIAVCDLFEHLERAGFENQLIEGSTVYEPPGERESMRHRYTHWFKPFCS